MSWRGLAAWLSVKVSGQAIVWPAVMMPLFLSVVGLAIDGGVPVGIIAVEQNDITSLQKFRRQRDSVRLPVHDGDAPGGP